MKCEKCGFEPMSAEEILEILENNYVYDKLSGSRFFNIAQAKIELVGHIGKPKPSVEEIWKITNSISACDKNNCPFGVNEDCVKISCVRFNDFNKGKNQLAQALVGKLGRVK